MSLTRTRSPRVNPEQADQKKTAAKHRGHRCLGDREHGLFAECAPDNLQADRQPVAIFSAWDYRGRQSCAVAPRHRPTRKIELIFFPFDIDLG
ncbi:MAG: hypothetical protein ACLPQ0_01790 [Candidatus Binatus sp.]|jgi:hypothetical protein